MYADLRLAFNNKRAGSICNILEFRRSNSALESESGNRFRAYTLHIWIYKYKLFLFLGVFSLLVVVGFVSLLVSIFCFLFLYFRLRFEEGIAGGIGIKRVYPLLLLVWNN